MLKYFCAKQVGTHKIDVQQQQHNSLFFVKILKHKIGLELWGVCRICSDCRSEMDEIDRRKGYKT